MKLARNTQQLQSIVERLLTQSESATLEFKRSWYQLAHQDPDPRKYQLHELIKDVLALANGAATTAGETAYLIIGADDTLPVEGRRKLFAVTDDVPTRRWLLEQINKVCAPALEALYCTDLVIDGCRLLVISIPPSPHLHETTADLQPSGKLYQKHTVFMREHEHIAVADERERAALRRMKTLQVEHTLKADPRLVGTGVGAIVGGLIWEAVTSQPIIPNAQGGARIINELPGVITGSFLGLICRYFYHNLRYLIYESEDVTHSTCAACSCAYDTYSTYSAHTAGSPYTSTYYSCYQCTS